MRQSIEEESSMTRAFIEENNRMVEKGDIHCAISILEHMVDGVNYVHDIGSLKSETKKLFGKSYGKVYIPVRYD